MAEKGVERELGQIRACVDGIKSQIQNMRTDQVSIFERLNKIEETAAGNNQKIINIERRIDDMYKQMETEREEQKKQKEAEREEQRHLTNVKLTVLAMVFGAIQIIVGALITLYHG